MKFSRNVKKKRALILGAALMTMPMLVGFKTDDTEKNISAVKAETEKTQSSNAEVSEPFKGSAKNTQPEMEKPVDYHYNSAQTTTSEVLQPPVTKDQSETEQPLESTENTTDTEALEQEQEEERVSQTDEMMREYMKQFDGRTIVEISFEGASEATLPTVQVAVTSHVGDEFNTEAIIRDRDAIRNTGYFYDAYPTFQEVPEGVMVTYHMLENPVLKDIVITGNTVIKTEELEEIITLQRGDILNSNTLHDNVAAIQEKYHGDGYILMKTSDMNISPDGVLTLKISEGVLEGYAVKGNKKTKDYVILREMRQKPGEVFNAQKARRSMERVYNLGFFEDVNVKMNPGVEPNAIIMEIDVEERRTGTFGIGAGYSSRDGLVGIVTVGDRNFRGTGDAINFSYESSADETDAHGFAFSYRRPWLDRHETAANLRIYNRTYEYSDYGTDGNLKERYMRKYSGFELTISRPMSEYSTNYITFKQRKDQYKRHVSDGSVGDRSTPAWANWRNTNFGMTRSITLQHITDTRDNVFNPTKGGKVTLAAEFGGLGGDFTFQKYSIEHNQYFKAGHAQVWALRGSYGYGTGDLTEFNQFRIGGQDTLRGYRDDQFRGDRMMLATLEYRFPLASKVQGIIFTDWGAAWDSNFLPKGNDIYGSVGLGLGLNTPLGALRLDYGRGKQGGRFHFSVGGGF